MKQIAILEYSFIFEPGDTLTNGAQFEHVLTDGFKQAGYELQIIETRGGTGRRVIFVGKSDTPEKVAQALQKEVKTTPASNQIKQVQSRTPTKDFKKFQNPKHPQVVVPKLGFQQPGRSNRQKVRYG